MALFGKDLKEKIRKSERKPIPIFLIIFLSVAGLVIAQVLFNLVNLWFGTSIPRFAGIIINGALIALSIGLLYRISSGEWAVLDNKQMFIFLFVFVLIVAFLIWGQKIPGVAELYSTKYVFSAQQLFG